MAGDLTSGARGVGPIPRRTLAGEARITGRGLFTGRDGAAVLRPGRGGLEFVTPGGRVPARAEYLSSQPVVAALGGLPARHTVLALDGAHTGARAVTVEHVLAALVGLGVTDAQIELVGCDELPIDDGSAGVFVRAIDHAGTVELSEAEAGLLRPIVIRETITVEDGRGGRITAEPSERVRYRYDFEHPLLGSMSARWDGSPASFRAQIARARTFSLRREVEQLRPLGLFEGFSPRDLLVLDDRGVPMDNQLRWPDEPARHKLLDLIGDLALAGAPLVGSITAERSGHALNQALARRLASASTGSLGPVTGA
jgi:UDP-3-O-[3-hydroxymyristoyl] N-acetylglucosamine deacetylase